MAVRKARYALEEAQQRLERTKTWARDYDRLISPLAKKVESLRDYLENDLTRAVAYLTEVQKILAAYAEASTPAPAPAES
jgi:DNA repair ATPase RecN